ncbi:Hypothetical protein FSTVST1_232 [Faustovirus ST1]|nr:Hypothetical protein FSTVST1_232 [Faustovirus ST1]
MISKNVQYIIAIILYIIAYVYSLIVAVDVKQCTKDICGDINNLHESCIIASNSWTRPLTQFRGDCYYIGADSETNAKSKQGDCLVTFWGMSHFFLYFALGLFTPGLFKETFAIGVAFEIYEYWQYSCHDAFDIVLNTTGWATGWGFGKLLDKLNGVSY